MELHIFKKNCDLVEASLLAKKKQIHEELGDSVAAVDEMIGEHEAFQRSVDAQKDRVAGIEKEADDLCRSGGAAEHFQDNAVMRSPTDGQIGVTSMR